MSLLSDNLELKRKLNELEGKIASAKFQQDQAFLKPQLDVTNLEIKASSIQKEIDKKNEEYASLNKNIEEVKEMAVYQIGQLEIIINNLISRITQLQTDAVTNYSTLLDKVEVLLQIKDKALLVLDKQIELKQKELDSEKERSSNFVAALEERRKSLLDLERTVETKKQSLLTLEKKLNYQMDEIRNKEKRLKDRELTGLL
jgi:DNA repair exonuclease SbcCD ATPase subunit